MIEMKRLTVFCGSNPGLDKSYAETAYILGTELAKRGIGVVYGGAKIGMMGALASGALDNGGEVIGVVPHFLSSKEIAHEHLSELIITETMHERKTIMNDLSDGVITLPGGYGTLEELLEMLTWAQLGLHKKPIAVLNINGFYDPLLTMIQTTVNEGYLTTEHQRIVITDSDISSLLEKMKNYKAPESPKWLAGHQL